MIELLQQTHELIDTMLVDKQCPAALISFGKDSVVLLDLLVEHGVRTALVLNDWVEIPDAIHIRRVIERYDLTVHEIPGSRVEFLVHQNDASIIQFAFVSDRHVVMFGNRLSTLTDAQQFICLDQQLSAIHATPPPFNPDVVFMGSKRTDVASDCAVITRKLKSETQQRHMREQLLIRNAAGLDICNPLLDWTDAQVWEYITTYKLPWSEQSYHPDHTKRENRHEWCVRCRDPREPATVHCPRINAPILNLAPAFQETAYGIEKMVRLGLLTPTEAEELNHA